MMPVPEVMMLPPILYFIAIVYLSLSLVAAALVWADMIAWPPKMRVMKWVWPLTMLYAGPLGLGFYFLYGRNKPAAGRWLRRVKLPGWAQILKSAICCGAGCVLGDGVAEAVAAAVHWGLAAKYLAAFVFAYGFGLVIHYAAIRQSGGTRDIKTIVAAAKADTLLFLVFQVGVVSWLVIARLVYPDIDAGSWDYWFMMQVAMCIGLGAAYPVNAMLIRRGIKSEM